jgi:hypothetical protein
MIAAGSADSFLDFVIPIIAMVAYFLVSMRKKKHAPKTDQGDEEWIAEAQTPPEKPALQPQPKIKEPLRSLIEERQIHSSLDSRQFATAISEDRAASLVSNALQQHPELDPAYALKPKSRPSRAQKLLRKQSSLRQAFLLQEIFKKPRDDF